MQELKKLKLIDNEFYPKEAKEILMNIFSSKILFHEMKNFSSIERFGREDINALKRILELKLSMENISEIILEAEKMDEKILIQSEVIIKTVRQSELC